MATSNSYDFSATRDEIIDSALRKAAGLGDYEEPTITQVTKAAFLLNSIIKSYHQIGMPLWTSTKVEISAALFDSEGKVTIGIGAAINSPKPLKISQCLMRLDDITRDLYITDKQTFNSYAHSALVGAPSAVFYQPKRTTGDLFVYPRPDIYHQTNGTIVLYHQTTLQDVDVSSNEIDFPVEWILLMIYELAVHLAPDYGLPTAERKLLVEERDALKKSSLNFDVEEGSIFIQP